jgi:hypothetical protein
MSRRFAGDGRSAPVVLLHQPLHAARSVVGGESRHRGVSGQKSPALRQRHRMRIDALNFADRYAGEDDQIVPDAQPRLPFHSQIVRQQQVEMLQDRARQAVFDGDDRGLGGSIGHGFEDVGGKRTGNDHRLGDQFHRCFVAE